MKARRTAVQRVPRNVKPSKERVLEELANFIEDDFDKKDSRAKKILRKKPRKSERER